MSLKKSLKGSTIFKLIQSRLYFPHNSISTRLSLFQEDFVLSYEERIGSHRVLLGLYQLDWQMTHCIWDKWDTMAILVDMFTMLSSDRLVIDPPITGTMTRTSVVAGNLVESLGGVQILTALFMEPPVRSKKSDTNPEGDDWSSKVVYMSLQILHALCSDRERSHIALVLAQRPGVVQRLLDLISDRTLSSCACPLLEDLVLHYSSVYPLSGLDFSGVMEKSSPDQLSNLCRILSYTIVDIHEESEELLQAIDVSRKKNEEVIALCGLNQEIICKLPGFLSAIMSIIVQESQMESRHVIQDYLEIALSVLDTNRSQPLIASLRFAALGVDSFPPTDSNLLEFFERVEKNKEMARRIEALVLLVGLLSGPHRPVVLDEVLRYRLIPLINDTFEASLWNRADSDLLEAAQRNERICQVSRSIHTMRVQLLRLVHSFCDKHINKYVMLTESEMTQLTTHGKPWANRPNLSPIFSTANLEVEDMSPISQMCTGHSGLLTKLVEVLKSEPLDSTLRFWLSRSVESFLRGEANISDQLFLISRGVLPHLVHIILSLNETTQLPRRSHDMADSFYSAPGNSYQEVIQGTFDFLGEVIKLNLDAFNRLADILNVDLEKFLAKIQSSIVDSNMFVRSALLSLEFFGSWLVRGPASALFPTGFVLLSNQLLAHFNQETNRFSYLIKLLDAVSLESLTQENVSCLNTALIMLLIAESHDRLPHYLAAIRCEERRNKFPGYHLHNLRLLLKFWQDHYSEDSADLKSLQDSSGIAYSMWNHLILILLREIEEEDDDCSPEDPTTIPPSSTTPSFHKQSVLSTNSFTL